jgi:mTERF domain-containing protein
MSRQALRAVAYLSEHKITDKVCYLKKTFRWSDDEVGIAVCKTPLLLLRSKDTLQIKSEFLLSEVGLVPSCALASERAA